VRPEQKLYRCELLGLPWRNWAGKRTFPPFPTGHAIGADGEVFWFITTGSVGKRHARLGSLPEEQRWQSSPILNP